MNQSSVDYPAARPARALILAAGFGKRMGRYTENLPKPLLPAGGLTLIEYTLKQLQRWGIHDIFVNLHYKGEMIEKHLLAKPQFNFTFLQEDKILGTAGALRTVCGIVDPLEPIVLINPDRLFKAAFEPGSLPSNASSLLYVLPKPHDSKEPGWELKNGLWVMNRQGGQYFYCGLSIVRPLIVESLPFNHFAELGPVWEHEAAEGRVICQPFEGTTKDAGVLEAYELVKNADLSEFLSDKIE